MLRCSGSKGRDAVCASVTLAGAWERGGRHSRDIHKSGTARYQDVTWGYRCQRGGGSPALATASLGCQAKTNSLCGLGQLGAQGLRTSGPSAPHKGHGGLQININTSTCHLPMGGLTRLPQPSQVQVPTVPRQPHLLSSALPAGKGVFIRSTL